MRTWYWSLIVVAACHRPVVDHAQPTPLPTTESGAPPVAPGDGGSPVEAGAPAVALDAGAAAVAPDAGAEAVEFQEAPLGPATALVRDICFIQFDCQDTGKLTQSAYVQTEQGGGRSCERINAPSTCPNDFLCDMASPWPREPDTTEGGRPRGQAKAELRKLVQKGIPCDGDPPGARLSRHSWCDTYRPDGTLMARLYYGYLAGGGERGWSQFLDEHGKVTREGLNCDDGHH